MFDEVSECTQGTIFIAGDIPHGEMSVFLELLLLSMKQQACTICVSDNVGLTVGKSTVYHAKNTHK